MKGGLEPGEKAARVLGYLWHQVRGIIDGLADHYDPLPNAAWPIFHLRRVDGLASQPAHWQGYEHRSRPDAATVA